MADNASKSQAPTAPEGGASPRQEGSKGHPARPVAESLVGRIVSGRYRIMRLIGEGGMGAVYQAEHTHMRKRLAVKVLHADMSRLPEVVARFENEAMAAAHIEHPNVATATDFGKLDDGSFFLVLEYVDGKSLRESINKGPLELGRALHIARQIAAALSRAHALGIVHRDLKPENVMLISRDGDTDFVKVLDFGIAKVPMGDIGVGAADKAPLTQMGMVYGTPEYMAPEQALGQQVDARADLYALGIMTYEMLAGSRPFESESKVALLGMHVTAPVPPFAEKAPHVIVPEEVEAVVRKLLSKEAGDRYAEAKELIETLTVLLAGLATDGRIDPKWGLPLPTGTTGLRTSMSGAGRGSLPSRSSAPEEGPASRTPRRLTPIEAAGTLPGPIPTPHPGGSFLRRLPRGFLPVAIGATLIGAGALALFTGGKDPSDLGVDSGPPALASGAPSSSPSTVPTSDADTKVQSAIALVGKGDYATAIVQLTGLDAPVQERADVQRALARAYLETKNPKAGMRALGKLFEVEPTATKEQKLLVDVRDTALGPEAQDQAFSLLERGMGTDGPDVLYNIAFELPPGKYGGAVNRARQSLKKADVRALASPGLLVTLDLRATLPCAAKKHLERATEVGDRRTVELLQPYLSTTGCGALQKRDCYPCLHTDGSLRQTITTIEQRLKAGAGQR